MTLLRLEKGQLQFRQAKRMAGQMSRQLQSYALRIRAFRAESIKCQPAAIVVVLIPNHLTILMFKKGFEYIVAIGHSRF
jgi:hypothetical protein